MSVAIREILGGRLSVRDYMRSLRRPLESAIFCLGRSPAGASRSAAFSPAPSAGASFREGRPSTVGETTAFALRMRGGPSSRCALLVQVGLVDRKFRISYSMTKPNRRHLWLYQASTNRVNALGWPSREYPISAISLDRCDSAVFHADIQQRSNVLRGLFPRQSVAALGVHEQSEDPRPLSDFVRYASITALETPGLK